MHFERGVPRIPVSLVDPCDGLPPIFPLVRAASVQKDEQWPLYLGPGEKLDLRLMFSPPARREPLGAAEMFESSGASGDRYTASTKLRRGVDAPPRQGLAGARGLLNTPCCAIQK